MNDVIYLANFQGKYATLFFTAVVLVGEDYISSLQHRSDLSPVKIMHSLPHWRKRSVAQTITVDATSTDQVREVLIVL